MHIRSTCLVLSSSSIPYSVLKNETHLVFVLLLGENLGSIGDGSNLLLNLFISGFDLSSSGAETFCNFIFYAIEFCILLLDLQGGFQLVDFWDLSNNLTSLLLESLDHGHVELTWLVLQEHLVNGSLDGVGLVGNILLESSDVGLDGLELGDGECSAHLSLLCIAKTLIKLQLEVTNEVLIGLNKAL